MRVFHKSLNVVGDSPPRDDEKTLPFHVGRGPSHATRAGERVPLAIVRALQRSRGTGPRATGEKTPSLHVGRGPVPRHRSPYDKNVSPSLQVRMTLMSIAAETREALRSFRSLIVFNMSARVLLRT